MEGRFFKASHHWLVGQQVGRKETSRVNSNKNGAILLNMWVHGRPGVGSAHSNLFSPNALQKGLSLIMFRPNVKSKQITTISHVNNKLHTPVTD